MRIHVFVIVAATLLSRNCGAYFEEFDFKDLSFDRIEPTITRPGHNIAKLRLSFTAYGRDFKVQLMENREILTQDFHVIIDDDAGGKRGQSFEREAQKIDPECKYYLSDDETLSATMSICGSNRVSGLLSVNGSTFLIRHGHETEGSSDHFVYHYEDVPCPTGRCLDTDPIQKVKEFLKQRTMKIEPHVRSTNPRVTPKYVELGLVYDKATLNYIVKIRGETVIDFTVKLIHAMSSVYSRLKISIVVKRLTLWTERDAISMYDDIEDTLLTFADYNVDKFDRKRGVDATILISAHPFIHSPGILGVALKSQTCENCELAVAVITMGSDFDVTHVAGVASHELGHCLGFDDEFYGKSSQECFAQCTEPVDQLSCIMRAVYTSASTSWSECTKHRVIDREVTHAYECLYNQPNISVKAICGNGLIERGEQCDCPPGDSACLSCCNVTTCRLKEGAECSSELCCQTSCRIDKSRKVCRPVLDQQCDMEDTCDGVSAVCFDNHKPDRTGCGQNMWCMSGKCESHCLKNCYEQGECVQVSDDWECSCHSGYSGRYCNLKSPSFPVGFFMAITLICFMAAFILTLLSFHMIRLCCKK